jgi:tRNA threonylcarbamoyladenosine biosynthesis protein TsaE
MASDRVPEPAAEDGGGVVERCVVLADAESTAALGRALGSRLRAGDCLALHGEVGAGKTTLVRGLAHGMALEDPDQVASPTYLLAIEHPGEPPLVHVDAYLPDKTRGFLLDGGLDYLLSEIEAVIAVEWAERIEDLLPTRRLDLFLEPAAGDSPHAGRVARLKGRSRDFPWLGTADLGSEPGPA